VYASIGVTWCKGEIGNLRVTPVFWIQRELDPADQLFVWSG
jgi:hypothetical protein